MSVPRVYSLKWTSVTHTCAQDSLSSQQQHVIQYTLLNIVDIFLKPHIEGPWSVPCPDLWVLLWWAHSETRPHVCSHERPKTLLNSIMSASVMRLSKDTFCTPGQDASLLSVLKRSSVAFVPNKDSHYTSKMSCLDLLHWSNSVSTLNQC